LAFYLLPVLCRRCCRSPGVAVPYAPLHPMARSSSGGHRPLQSSHSVQSPVKRSLSLQWSLALCPLGPV
uniref:Uncharacterized protein n=1 Tax=Zosterops lateralis melanops TaxID=1220523 RepID=A0A8D2QUB6_ZOSLA